MKNYSFITKLAVAFVVAGVPIAAQADTSQDKTGTGSIKLSRPGSITMPADAAVQGGLSSNIAFSAAVRETTGAPIVGEGQAFGTLPKAVRVSNKTIIESTGQDPRGRILVLLHEGNLGAKPRVAVYDRKNKSLVAEVDVNVNGGISADLNWIDFVGVYRGDANVAETISKTFAVASGSLRGFTGYEAKVNVADNIVDMSGVGSFTQNNKGISGSAKLAGSFIQAQ
jgi:hypothetical protein